METISFTIYGLPTPKGSLTRMPNRAYLQAGSANSREKAAAWREDIRSAATQAMGERLPYKSAIRLQADFNLPYPATLIRKYQHGWWPHLKKPDVDKLLRSVMDHLTGIVWVDDAQVIAVMLGKHYAWETKTGANITVDALGEDELRSIAYSRTIALTMLEAVNEH